MKTIFIDTSAFYALLNRDDPHHQKASHFYQSEPIIFVTTYPVFTELLSLLTKRQGKAIAIRCGLKIKSSEDKIKIVHLSYSQTEKAWDLFCRHKDKNYDLIDCLSFVCMEEKKLKEAFAFDRHFAQYGFRLACA